MNRKRVEPGQIVSLALLCAACGVSDRELSLATGGAAGSSGAGGFGAAGAGGTSAGGTGAGGSAGSGGSGGSAGSGAAGGSGGTGGSAQDGCAVLAAAVENPAKLVATFCNSYVGETSVEKVVGDLSTYDVEVMTWDSVQSQFKSLQHTITAPGVFEVQSPPAGAYYLRFNKKGATPTWVVATTKIPDLGAATLGRKNQVKPAGTDTLQLDVTGAAAWQPTDGVEVISIGGGLVGFETQAAASGAPATGSTWLNYGFPVGQAWKPGTVDATQGDVLWVTQLATKSNTVDTTVRGLARAVKLTDFKQTAPASTVTGVLTTPTTPPDVKVDVSVTNLMSMLVTPFAAQGVKYTGLAFGCYAEPQASADARILFGPSLFDYVTSATTDVSQTFAYADPFPSNMPRRCFALFTTRRLYTLPGAPAKAFSSDTDFSADLAAGSMTLKPWVGPVQNLKVEGKDAFVDVTLTSTTPEITWAAPATTGGLQAAERYAVGISELFVDASGSPTLKATSMGTVYTTQTQVRVPPGVFQKSKYYFFRIWTSASGGIDRSVHFWRSGMPNGSTIVMSGLITAPKT